MLAIYANRHHCICCPSKKHTTPTLAPTRTNTRRYKQRPMTIATIHEEKTSPQISPLPETLHETFDDNFPFPSTFGGKGKVERKTTGSTATQDSREINTVAGSKGSVRTSKTNDTGIVGGGIHSKAKSSHSWWNGSRNEYEHVIVDDEDALLQQNEEIQPTAGDNNNENKDLVNIKINETNVTEIELSRPGDYHTIAVTTNIIPTTNIEHTTAHKLHISDLDIELDDEHEVHTGISSSLVTQSLIHGRIRSSLMQGEQHESIITEPIPIDTTMKTGHVELHLQPEPTQPTDSMDHDDEEITDMEQMKQTIMNLREHPISTPKKQKFVSMSAPTTPGHCTPRNGITTRLMYPTILPSSATTHISTSVNHSPIVSTGTSPVHGSPAQTKRTLGVLSFASPKLKQLDK